MANKMTDTSEKKTVPVNILLTEDVNLALSALALQVSTAAARITKSDIVRATLQAGLPLLDLVHKLTPDLPLAQMPDLLTSKPVIGAVEQLAQEHAGMRMTRGTVRTRDSVRTRGQAQDDADALATPPVGSTAGIELVAPVNTGVSQAPTFAWKLHAEIITAHRRARTTAPITCSVRVLDEAQEVWSDRVEIPLATEAIPEQEAQIVRSVAMPAEIFEQLSPLAWKRWTVRVSYRSRAGTREEEATSLFLKVAPSQAARAAVEGLVAQGRAYEAQGLLEDATTFFRDALETSCQQLVALYRMRGLAQADAYQKLLEELTELR